MTYSPLLDPVIAMVAWSMVMLAWLYITRIPAIFQAKIKFDSHAPRGTQLNALPGPVRWKADNYNHLMEQPTLFYAIVIVLALMGEHTKANIILAWLYVISRVVHSLVQALINHIPTRFTLFMFGSFTLAALVFNAMKVAYF